MPTNNTGLPAAKTAKKTPSEPTRIRVNTARAQRAKSHKKQTIQNKHKHPAIMAATLQTDAKVPNGLSLAKPARELRAKQTQKSRCISRFGTGDLQPVPVTYAPIPVQQIPRDSGTVTLPVIARFTNARAHAKPDMFEQAVATSTHFVDLAALKHTSRRQAFYRTIVMAGSGAAILLISFLAYQDIPALRTHVANLRTGIAAAAPDSSKPGVSYAGVTAVDNKRVLEFRSAGGQLHRLTERNTNWEEQDMIMQVGGLAPDELAQYTTLAAGPVTMYRFADGSATWVKHGTWYHLDTTRGLSDNTLRQLIAKN